jgi:hypothetical protein
MLRHAYLTSMGAMAGAITAMACGHTALWLGVGVVVGLAWSVQPRVLIASLYAR